MRSVYVFFTFLMFCMVIYTVKIMDTSYRQGLSQSSEIMVKGFNRIK